MQLLIFMAQVVFTAVNVVVYVETGRPFNLGAAIFCGAFALLALANLVNGR